MWLDWAVISFFQRIKTNSSNFCLKSYIWLNIWTKWGKNWPKNCQKLFVFSNNAITSKVFGIFLWNKKQWKADKITLKLIYTFIYFMYLFSPNFASIFQMPLKFGHFGHFLVFPSFFCQMWLDWTVFGFFSKN